MALGQDFHRNVKELTSKSKVVKEYRNKSKTLLIPASCLLACHSRKHLYIAGFAWFNQESERHLMRIKKSLAQRFIYSPDFP